MRVRILGRLQRNLALGAAVIIIGGFTAGCSSDTARFADGLTTGSTGRPVVSPPANQPFPGDVGSSVRSPSTSLGGGVSQPSYRVSNVQQSNLGPVSSGSLPPVSSQDVGPAPVHRSARLDQTVTGATYRAENVPTPSRSGASHWSRAGGTEITVGQGENVETLSRRFGVPEREILRANGLSPSHRIAAGEKIIIPTFVYSSNAHGSQTRVAEARPAREPERREPSREDLAPRNLGVLPQSPRQREKMHLDENASAAAKKVDKSRHEEVRSASALGAGQYKVQSGDSLHSIARKTGARVEAIRQANNLKTDFLHVGQVLTIPGSGNQKVASAAPKNVDPVVTGTASSSASQQPTPDAKNESHPAAYTPPQKTEKVIADTGQKEAAVAPETTGIGKMRWPVRGRIITPFGGSGGAASDGIDIAVPDGTSVKAAENGVVIYAGNGLKDFGNTVLIRHDDGLVTVYGHNSKLEVTRGEKVRRGQEIALSGMSGTTPSPRLHFEVRKNSAPVNPTKYLE
ncbi:MAG TPA: LysM peptidoglycan-binding domain-containing M23 family metallopeptidase [Rhizobiaceae bacterium]|nr:LysM peptidoglycan-binding domain-containing M23 family metallopeptidase [Rhizobiaceae bacterium]